MARRRRPTVREVSEAFGDDGRIGKRRSRVHGFPEGASQAACFHEPARTRERGDLVADPSLQPFVAQRRAWRKLAELIGRRDLVPLTGDTNARELAAAALAHGGSQTIALLRDAGLEHLRWDMGVRHRAQELRAQQQTQHLGKRKREVSLAL